MARLCAGTIGAVLCLECGVLPKDHHEGYIGWEEYERNQEQLARYAYGKAGGSKSGRGGRALLSGLLCCTRCGRRLQVVYGRINQALSCRQAPGSYRD